ncbi:hypothetical protein HPB48_019151 [Haemaphysalis longicornis]|uniref:G-protein coupled receptors family 1 profile domain-containing protein n=1 Tax=Haemaphysalis longicornis TaxID=44386 RepID=A0A9J6FUF7_HAELO|nr:hypothetical protein HPB48_019151 [Haemaphysalis longicornis]
MERIEVGAGVHETSIFLFGFLLTKVELQISTPAALCPYCSLHIRAAQDGGGNEYARSTRLRCSDMRRMQRAQYRTLRLTVVIVLAFFLCWTPYVVMVLWYQLDAASAKDVDDYLQSSLFMFAVSNSCVNPLVYGSYTGRFKLPCCQPGCFPPERVRPQPTFKDNDGRYYSSLRRISRRTLHSWIPKTVVAAVATVGAKQERAALPRDCGPLCIVEMRDMCAFTADGGCMPSPMEPRSAQVNRAAHCAALSPKKNHSL